MASTKGRGRSTAHGLRFNDGREDEQGSEVKLREATRGVKCSREGRLCLRDVVGARPPVARQATRKMHEGKAGIGIEKEGAYQGNGPHQLATSWQ